VANAGAANATSSAVPMTYFFMGVLLW